MLTLESVYFGQKHKDFDTLKKIIGLARKHQRQCENSCNGQGIVNGQSYYTGLSYGQNAGEYEKREYGYNVISAYLSNEDEETIFDHEIDKIQDKINIIVDNSNFKVNYQHDPRGYTVKISYNESFIDY